MTALMMNHKQKNYVQDLSLWMNLIDLKGNSKRLQKTINKVLKKKKNLKRKKQKNPKKKKNKHKKNKKKLKKKNEILLINSENKCFKITKLLLKYNKNNI